MTLAVYDKDEPRRIEVAFTNADGTATDPTTVRFQITKPSGAVITEVYGESPSSIVPSGSTGGYYRDVTLDEVGRWYGRWVGEGTVQVVEEFQFSVKGTGY